RLRPRPLSPPATPPPAAPVARKPRLPSRWTAVVGLAAATELCCYIVEDTMPRRKSTSSRPDPAMAALLQTLNPHAAGIDVGATEVMGLCASGPHCVRTVFAPWCPSALAPQRPPLWCLHGGPARHPGLAAAVPADDRLPPLH